MIPSRAGRWFLQWRFGKNLAILWVHWVRQFKHPKTFFFALKEPNFSVLPEALPCFYIHPNFCILRTNCLLDRAGGAVTCTHLPRAPPRTEVTHGAIPHTPLVCSYLLAQSPLHAWTLMAQAHSIHMVLVTRIHHLLWQTAANPKTKSCFKQIEMFRTYQTSRWKSETYSSELRPFVQTPFGDLLQIPHLDFQMIEINSIF